MIRLCMALAAATLMGCTTGDAPGAAAPLGTPVFTAGTRASGAKATCDQAAFLKRHFELGDEVSDALGRATANKDNEFDGFVNGVYRLNKTQCLIKKDILEKRLNQIKHGQNHMQCAPGYIKASIANETKMRNSELKYYQSRCGHHNL